MIGSMLIGEIEQKTNFTVKNVDHFEKFINARLVDYFSEDAVFTGWLHKLNAPEFNRVNRALYGRGTDLIQDIVDYTRNKCYILKVVTV